MDIRFHEGLFYLLTNTTWRDSEDGSQHDLADHYADPPSPRLGRGPWLPEADEGHEQEQDGCLSIWDGQGQLLVVHQLFGGCPNGLAVFRAAT